MATHDLADLLDVGRPIAGKHGGDFLEVARTRQSGTDGSEEAGVDIVFVGEAVDNAAPFE